MSYGESFISERSQTYRCLPISDYTLEAAERSDRENLESVSYKINTFQGNSSRDATFVTDPR